MKYIMHKHAMDVAIEILAEKNFQYAIRYINLGYTGNPWLCNSDVQYVDKHKIDLANYTLLTGEQLKIVRTKPGLPI